MTIPCTATSTSHLPGRVRVRLLLALLCVLAPAAGPRADDACHLAFRAGDHVWYAVETHPRVSRTFDSGCATATDRQPQVSFFMKGAREVIVCDRELPLPDAMQAELSSAQHQGSSVLPSRRPTLDTTWTALVHKYSAALPCAPGYQRMSDASSGVPSVWCRRQLTTRELCPTGGTFTTGACYAVACPEGMVDLDRSTGGKLMGCARCPVGRLDVEESVSWRDLSAWSSSGHGPVTAVLCKARASDLCPAVLGSTPAPAPARVEGRVGALEAALPGDRAAGR